MNLTKKQTRLALPAVRLALLLTLCAAGARPQENYEPAARAFLAEKPAETWAGVVAQAGADQLKPLNLGSCS